MAECKLPEDLMLCILTRLPVKSLCRFKCVCKPWLSLFSSSDFIARHRDVTASNLENHSLGIYSPYIFDSERVFFFFNANSTIIEAIKLSRRSLQLVGSYNGLVTLRNPATRQIILWNPATRQWKSFCHPDGLDNVFTVGMGFDSATNDFKVLSMVGTFPFPGDSQQANVYSANRDCWEKVELGFKFWANNLINDAILSGVPYWRGLAKDLGDESGFSDVYVRFDVKNGVFDHIPMPKLDVNSKTTTCLVEWKNSLAVLVLHSPEEENVVGVVIFDECQGEWTTKFTVGPIGIPIARRIWYCKGTEILMQTRKGKLFWFDSETNRTKEICTERARCAVFEDVGPFNYIESLVHLKDMKMVKEIEGRIQFDISRDSVEEEELSRSFWGIFLCSGSCSF